MSEGEMKLRGDTKTTETQSTVLPVQEYNAPRATFLHDGTNLQSAILDETELLVAPVWQWSLRETYHPRHLDPINICTVPSRAAIF